MNNRPPVTDKKTYPAFLSYEIYDAKRFRYAVVVPGIIAGIMLTMSYLSTETSTDFALGSAISLLASASMLQMFLKAEDRDVKAARAGYKVYNVFRGTYSDGKNHETNELDSGVTLKSHGKGKF